MVPYWKYYNFKREKNNQQKPTLLILPTFSADVSCISLFNNTTINNLKKHYHIVSKSHHATHFNSDNNDSFKKLQALSDDFYDSDTTIVELLQKSDIVLSFRKMANKRSKNMLPSVSDWDNLLLVVSQYFPNLNSKLTENNTLKEIELYVCMLLFLDFSPGDMAYLLDRSSQRITNIQRDSNQKLFGESTSKTLKSNLNYIALNS